MAGISLQGVSRHYPGGVTAVDNVTLEVPDREFVVLVGPSGCGKSTTLRMIAGLEEIDAGVIRIGDRAVNDVPPKDRDIAMVFQNYALYPHMTVRDNMAFGLRLRQGSSWAYRLACRLLRPAKGRELAARQREIEHRVQQTAESLGIAPLLGRLPQQLSGGERQRVALGRAIVRQPVAFLFDEPLSNLDARLRVDLRRELKQLHGRLATTILYVTHDQVEALTLGDRVVVMDRGAVQQAGSPQEVYDRPANRFVAGFIGSPPMNLLDGRLIAGEGESRFLGGNWELRIDSAAAELVQQQLGCPAVFGIRPEDMRLVPGDAFPEPAAEWCGPAPAGVLAVEPLGDSTIVHVQASAAAQPLLVRTDARFAVPAGGRVSVYFNMRRAHWFSGLTGERLNLPKVAEGN